MGGIDAEGDLSWLLRAGFGVHVSPVSHRQLSTFQVLIMDVHLDKRCDPPDEWRGEDLAILLAEARAWAQVRGYGPPADGH